MAATIQSRRARQHCPGFSGVLVSCSLGGRGIAGRGPPIGFIVPVLVARQRSEYVKKETKRIEGVRRRLREHIDASRACKRIGALLGFDMRPACQRGSPLRPVERNEVPGTVAAGQQTPPQALGRARFAAPPLRQSRCQFRIWAPKQYQPTSLAAMVHLSHASWIDASVFERLA